MSKHVKWTGLCTVCDTPCFEVKETYPNDHPLAGLPRKIGRPLDSARRITLILSDSSRADITLCDQCYVTSETLPGIWRRCREALAHEATNATRLMRDNTQPLSVREQWVHGKFQLQLAATIPVGVLYEQKWQEVAHNG